MTESSCATPRSRDIAYRARYTMHKRCYVMSDKEKHGPKAKGSSFRFNDKASKLLKLGPTTAGASFQHPDIA